MARLIRFAFIFASAAGRLRCGNGRTHFLDALRRDRLGLR